jgi:hypothetical protein
LRTDGNKTDECHTCKRGYYSDKQNARNCSECPLGFFAQENGRSDRCQSCPRGTHGSATNATDLTDGCNNCTSGRYSELEAVPYADGCKGCPKGKWNSNVGTVHCDTCSAGTYNNANASTTECKVCTAGQYENDTGSALCKLCPAGKTLTTAATAEYHDELADCEDCGILQFNPFEGHAEACYLCLTAKTTGSSQCDGCDPGKFENTIVSPDGDKTNECIDCESGYFSIKQNVKVCDECPKGYFANHQLVAGETQAKYDRCQACPRGTFGMATRANNASEGCSNCTSGKYSEVTGISNADACKECPRGECRLLYLCVRN